MIHRNDGFHYLANETQNQIQQKCNTILSVLNGASIHLLNMDQVRLVPSYLWYMTLYDSFIRCLSEIMTNIKIFLINCTTLSRNRSVEPKNKEKKNFLSENPGLF